MFKIAISLLSFCALITNASNTVRRLMQIPATGVAAGSAVQPIIPGGVHYVTAGAGYGAPAMGAGNGAVVPSAGAGYGAYGGAATMGNGAVVPGYGAPAMGAGNGAVVPGYGSGYGATAPGYGMVGGNQPIVPYGGVAPPAGYHWVLGLEPLYPGQVVPNNGVMPKYEQPGSEGRR